MKTRQLSAKAAILICLATGFASCSQIETPSTVSLSDKEIVLTSYGNISKSSAEFEDSRISAYIFSEGHIPAQQLFSGVFSHENGLWDSGRVNYWPEEVVSKGKHLAVFGVMPATITLDTREYTGMESDRLPSFTYSVAANAADQKDVKVAKTIRGNPDEMVELKFNSVMSEVSFRVKGSQCGSGNTIYHINSITVRGAYADGMYEFTSGRMRLASGAAAMDFTYACNQTVGTGDWNLGADFCTMYMIPQKTKDVEVVFNYSVEVDGMKIFEGNYGLGFGDDWAQGEVYDYSVELPYTDSGIIWQIENEWNDNIITFNI